jgi:hypothetical protein
LAFWVSEPSLVRELRRRGLEYTRFVDDITVSSKRRLTVSEQSEVVGKIYGMLHSAGVKPKRSKHEVQTAKGRITTTKLVNNTRVSLSAEVRQNIRAAVYQLEARVAFGEHNAALWKQIMSVSSRVGRLNSFHPTEGKQLTTRIKALRKNFEAHKESTSASLSNGISLSVDASSTTKPADPPWL